MNIHRQKEGGGGGEEELWPYPHTLHKNRLNRIYRLTCKIIKVLGKKWEKISRPRVLSFDTKSIVHKGKVNKLDFIKILQFVLQDPVKKIFFLSTEWEKISSNQIFDIGLIFGIYIKLSVKTMNNSIRTWAKVMHRHFTEEDIQMENKQWYCDRIF